MWYVDWLPNQQVEEQIGITITLKQLMVVAIMVQLHSIPAWSTSWVWQLCIAPCILIKLEACRRQKWDPASHPYRRDPGPGTGEC